MLQEQYRLPCTTLHGEGEPTDAPSSYCTADGCGSINDIEEQSQHHINDTCKRNIVDGLILKLCELHHRGNAEKRRSLQDHAKQVLQ